MSEQAIVLNELTKHYGKHRGINNLSFSVNQGEFFGFIGPNGAGKSTTIRTLMGLIRPTGGSASIFDLDCHSKASVIARDVGYLPSENRPFSGQQEKGGYRVCHYDFAQTDYYGRAHQRIRPTDPAGFL